MRTVVVLLTLAAAVLGCSTPAGPPDRHPMIVVGVDGGEWTVIEELWRQGRLPTLRGLADRGSRAVLATSWTESPVIWTTIATGVLPSVHGITGFVAATPQGDVPVSSSVRRVPALWNMLSSLERRVMVAGWWASWPAEEVQGVVVSDRVLETIDRTFSPASFAPEVERGLRESATEPSPFSDLEAGEPRDRAIAWFARRLASEDFDLLLAYFGAPDHASHYYWEFFAGEAAPEGSPSLERTSASDDPEVRRKRELIFGAYEAVDRTVAAMVEAADRPVNVIVLSDHGFRSAREEQVKVTLDLDAVLERLGWLARDAAGGVDLARSRAYTWASTNTGANKMVRFGGAVGDGARAETREALGHDLARLTWAGGDAAFTVAPASPRVTKRGGDLVVQVRTDSAAAPLLLDGQAVDGVTASVRRITGAHGPTTSGILIAAGPDIAAGAALDGIHVKDMTPTFLYGLGAPVARDFAGRPWRELYTAEFRRRHPLRAIESWGKREYGEAVSSAADEKLLEQLRALGYLD